MRTIVAVATGAGGNAGVGIVRMSGEDAERIAKTVFRVRGGIPDLEPNRMTLGTIDGETFSEQAFCVYFKAPLSYTGEDVVEFHCHGGKAVLTAVVKRLVDEGASPAARGEFTKRAFLNGKMTLDHAEGVLGMIEADSRAELAQSSRLMGGALLRDVECIRGGLLSATANLEVSLDYPEETEEELRGATLVLLKRVRAELYDAAEKAKLGRLIREGAKVAIVGKPNAGKSSLLNAILKEDRAIVTEIAGTTRDTLEGTTELCGVKVTFVDTAGLRETDDTVERLGVARALRAEAEADLVLRVVDLSDGEMLPTDINFKKTIVVGNKFDVAEVSGAEGSSSASASTPTPRPIGAEQPDLYRGRIASDAAVAGRINVSAKTGAGIDALLNEIAKRLDFTSAETASVITNERHRAAVETALGATESAISGYENNTIDCILVDVKEAYRALGEIAGTDVSESIVDKIFESFCVGK